MSDVSDKIPRSTMTTAQQRRIGSLQAAKTVLQGGGYGAASIVQDAATLLEVASWIDGAETARIEGPR